MTATPLVLQMAPCVLPQAAHRRMPLASLYSAKVIPP